MEYININIGEIFMKKLVILIVCIVVIFLVGCGCNNSTKISNDKRELQKLVKGTKDTLKLELYFDSGNKKSSKVAKEERILDTEEIIGEIVISELIKGPGIKSELEPIFPKDTKLISFSIKKNTAIVNLSKEVQSNMDIVKEEVCLKAIVASLSQLESIEEVLIQVDSRTIKTLGGNFDVSEPIKKDAAFTRINK